LPVPTLYDISGSANWANKADLGLVVYRDLDNGNIVELYLRKVRFKEIGQVGVVELQWDRVTGRYSAARGVSTSSGCVALCHPLGATATRY
jgi:twinkle protein